MDGDLLQGTALEQFDEGVAGDLAGEPRTACAEDAALPVQQDCLADLDRLLVVPLGLDEAGLPRPIRERLVLERALAPFVTHGAVEWVVDQQELEGALLAGARDLAGELGLDDHAVGDGGGAGGERLALADDLDQALAAGAERQQQLMVVDGHFHRGLLVRHRAPCRVFDGDADVALSPDPCGGSSLPPRPPKSACAVPNGQPWPSTCWSNSSRKYWRAETIGLTAPSPRAQKERPKIESQMSFSVSMSSLRPAPVSSRVRILAIQSVPSRQGVHLPQDSWA